MFGYLIIGVAFCFDVFQLIDFIPSGVTQFVARAASIVGMIVISGLLVLNRSPLVGKKMILKSTGLFALDFILAFLPTLTLTAYLSLRAKKRKKKEKNLATAQNQRKQVAEDEIVEYDIYNVSLHNTNNKRNQQKQRIRG